MKRNRDNIFVIFINLFKYLSKLNAFASETCAENEQIMEKISAE